MAQEGGVRAYPSVSLRKLGGCRTQEWRSSTAHLRTYTRGPKSICVRSLFHFLVAHYVRGTPTAPFSERLAAARCGTQALGRRGFLLARIAALGAQAMREQCCAGVDFRAHGLHRRHL